MAKASGGTKGYEVVISKTAESQSKGAAHDSLLYESPSGGNVTVNEQRIESSRKSKNERKKFDKEFAMCRVLADNGYKVVMLAETPGISSPDITLDGQKAELKSVSCTSTHIVDYARKAKERQGAEIVIFEFDEITPEVNSQMNRLSRDDIHGIFYAKGNKELKAF